ncbi:MAG: Fic family protein [Nanoarchaeota archaeon]|nr:Fic family protein [Nanoarchaeota archaeon]
MAKGSFSLISKGIFREILRKKQILERNPEYHLHYSNGKKKALRKEANKHSVSLELEGYNTSTTQGRKRKSFEQKRSQKNLEKAMEYGLNYYQGELTREFIEEMGRKMEPTINNNGYRTEKVRISGAMWSPPSEEKLEREMDLFLFENNSLDNIIERASHAHFHVARIHPFLDGNGRTAREVQNIILENGGFFPSIIKLSERLEYIHLLDNAVNSYKIAEGNLSAEQLDKLQSLYDFFKKDNVTEKEREYYKGVAISLTKAKMAPEQHDFYNFLALKIRDVLREETEKLYGLTRRKYRSK